ncbi:MAG TPA: hypothetical protein DCL41_03310 [Bdellovibrionales bacterium]|nr:hypothetical protein [Pseudobdellovibrionaceae bacterium]HAG90869.1 hypothetical protein [Bdellovibrionales bacterium]|tara:strand:+ start:5406 stop:6071 length:666 start_codon:yes stop_codon:yes gene_type:complete
MLQSETLMKNLSRLMFAAFIIPLQPTDWKILKYGSIPPNKVEFSEDHMKVSVNSSNNPIIFPLKEPVEYSGFEASFSVSGNPMPAVKEWDDDALVRIGFVAEGERTMNRALLWFSPSWIKELFHLAPKGSGIDKIYFFNLGRPNQTLGQKRIFPKTKDLVSEEIVALYKEGQKDYKISHSFQKPRKIAGLWLSMDGDVTKTKFDVIVKEIKLLEPMKAVEK